VPYVGACCLGCLGLGGTMFSPQGFPTCVLLLVTRCFSKALGPIVLCKRACPALEMHATHAYICSYNLLERLLCKQIKLMEKGLMGREEKRT